jgi:putative inorganic carbon (hco3(-)) transporter
MNETSRWAINGLRFTLAALLGALLAVALFGIWDLEERWLLIAIAAIVGLAISMCLVHVFSDFALIAFMFSMPVMSFQKWFWADRWTDEERGNLVYSGALGIGLLDAFLVAAYLSWFYRIFVIRAQPLPRLNLLDAAIAWLLIAHLLSSIGSAAPDLALGADIYLLKFAMLYFYLSRNLNPRLLPWLLVAFGLTIALEASLGVVQFATGKWLGIALDKGAGGEELNYQYAVPGLAGFYRATGTCYDSHSLGNFVGLMLPFALVLALTPRLRGPLRLFFTGIGALAVLTVLLSLSRSAWLAVAIANFFGAILVVAIWRERQVTPALAAGVVLVVLAVPLAGGFVYERFANAPSGTLTVRYEQYSVALWIIEQYPIFGDGPGNWYEALEKHDPAWLEEVLPVHNVLLWMTADVGIFGVGAYLAIYLIAACRLIAAVRKRRDLAGRLAMATLIALISTLLNGMTDPTFREPNVFTLFWVLIALVVVVTALPPGTGDEYLQPRTAPDRLGPRSGFPAPGEAFPQ